MPGSLPSAIRDSMNSRSLRSKMMVVRLMSSPFVRASGSRGLSGMASSYFSMNI